MPMKRFSLSIILSLFWLIPAAAQTNLVSFNNDQGLLFFNANDSIPTTYEGSPYWDKEFKPASLSCYSKELKPEIRYNAYKDEMEFKKEGKLYYLEKKDSCEIVIDNKVYGFFAYPFDGKIRFGYLRRISLNTATYTLLARETIAFQEGEPAVTSYREDKPAKFYPEKVRFFIKTPTDMIGIPEKKKDLERLLTNIAPDIASFFKQIDFKIKEEASLLELTQYLNALAKK